MGERFTQTSLPVKRFFSLFIFIVYNRIDIELHLILNNDIDDLNSNLKWKLLGKTTNSNPIVIPHDYSELNILIKCTSGNSVIFHICKELFESNDYFDSGYYKQNNVFGMVQIQRLNNTIKVQEMNINGTNYTNNNEMIIYYR